LSVHKFYFYCSFPESFGLSGTVRVAGGGGRDADIPTIAIVPGVGGGSGGIRVVVAHGAEVPVTEGGGGGRGVVDTHGALVGGIPGPDAGKLCADVDVDDPTPVAQGAFVPSNPERAALVAGAGTDVDVSALVG